MRHVKIVMTVEMIDENTRERIVEELELAREEMPAKTVEMIKKLEQIREEIPVMTVEMMDENTRERIAEDLELMREDMPAKAIEMIEKLE